MVYSFLSKKWLLFLTLRKSISGWLIYCAMHSIKKHFVIEDLEILVTEDEIGSLFYYFYFKAQAHLFNLF